MIPPAPPPPYWTRLSVLFASDAPRAVILRRGPRHVYRLVSWNTANDTFERGQWMRGTVKLCDLSPDGSKLLYWAAQYGPRRASALAQAHRRPFDPVKAGAGSAIKRLVKRQRQVPRYLAELAGTPRGQVRVNTGTWTAISTPPFFTALAIWPAVGCWTGGGVFRGNHEIALYESAEGLAPQVNVELPKTFAIGMATSNPAAGVIDWRSARHPDDAGDALKPLRATLEAAGCRWIDWIDTAHTTDLRFAANGKVYRLGDWRDVPPAEYLAQAKLLIDLCEDQFAPMAPTAAALRW